MRRFSVLHRDANDRFRRVVCALALLSVVLVRWTSDGSITAQLNSREITIYETCVDKEWRRVQKPECGVDEAATEAARAEQQIAEESLMWRIERNKSITPEQESRVQNILDRRGDGTKQKQIRFMNGVVSTALARITPLLQLPWNASDRKVLDTLSHRFHDHEESLKRTRLSRDQLDHLRDSIRSDTIRLQEVIVRKPRSLEPSQPVENIVTRMDALVATIGTVLIEIERDGVVVPLEVEEGYQEAKDSIRIAKRSCSMRRPKACSKLWDVLMAIEAMRQPLCELPSKRLTFCNG